MGHFNCPCNGWSARLALIEWAGAKKKGGVSFGRRDAHPQPGDQSHAVRPPLPEVSEARLSPSIIGSMDRKELSDRIDHSCLKAEATEQDIEQFCREARENGFYAVCVNPCRVGPAAANLAGSDVKVCSVVGFPLGAVETKLKSREAEEAVRAGADEVDMVMNLGWFLEGHFRLVEEDIGQTRSAIGEDTVLKVIIETALLTAFQKSQVAQLVVEGGADFVKTSTGFHPGGGAAVEDVLLLCAVVGNRIRVKASGGIRDTETSMAMIEAGADRIGTSSGVAIVNGLA